MRNRKFYTSLALTVLTLGTALPIQADTADTVKDSVATYRLYNKNTGEHFYTQSVQELISLQKVGWNNEGIGWYSPASGTPVYRIYNPNAKGGDHYYTISKGEADHNVKLGWKWDNNGAPVFYAGGEVKTYVAYNPNAQSGAHNYTTNGNEQDNLLWAGWKYGAVAWNAVKTGTDKVDLNQIKNHDTTTIQGLWKNKQGKTLEIVGDQFILNGENITNYRQYKDDGTDYVVKSIWDKDGMISDGRNVTLLVQATGGYGILVAPAWIIQDEYDKSDPSKDRIMIGQEMLSSSAEAFYRV
ncbi:CHAP domain-containing protein [Lactovum odontotermitis]